MGVRRRRVGPGPRPPAGTEDSDPDLGSALGPSQGRTRNAWVLLSAESGSIPWLGIRNATAVPSAEIASSAAVHVLVWTPSGRTLTRTVRRVPRSRRKTSPTPVVSPATRLVASELKAR